MNWFRPLALATFVAGFTQPVNATISLINRDKIRDDFISQLLSKISLDEKVGQLRLIFPDEDIPQDKLLSMVVKDK